MGAGELIDISIHAPVKGATGVRCTPHQTGKNFNPRSRKGSDVQSAVKALGLPISIHAPVKGATGYA